MASGLRLIGASGRMPLFIAFTCAYSDTFAMMQSELAQAEKKPRDEKCSERLRVQCQASRLAIISDLNSATYANASGWALPVVISLRKFSLMSTPHAPEQSP